MRYQAGVAAAAQVAELTPQTAGAVTKLAETEKALEQVQAELSPLREQAQQLSVYKSVFANGDILRDLDASYRKEKAPLSPERQLGLGTLRLLTKGGADPAAVDAFTRALGTTTLPRFEVLSYAEHSLGQGSEARAVSYIQIKTERGVSLFGAGIDTNIELASIKAIVSALNRALAKS